MRKISLFVTLFVFLSAGCSPEASQPTVAAVEPVETQPAESTPPLSSGFTSFIITTAPEDVAGVAGEVKIGFNNSEQVVDAGNGNTLMTWVAGQTLMLVRRGADGAVYQQTPLAEGRITLPTIAKSGATVAVAWAQDGEVRAVISHNDGAEFGPITTLGAGSGPSLAADGGSVVAVWHDGSEELGSARIMFRKYADGSWDEAARVDASTKVALWAAVSLKGEQVFVVWRDNRDGEAFTVWLRRSVDGGISWLDEQQIEPDISADPDICTADGETVWIAHQGKGVITLRRSTDAGATFEEAQTVGNGYFAHLACAEAVVGVAWESTTEAHNSTNKQVGWAIYTHDLEPVGADTLADGVIAASTIYLNGSTAEVLWIKTSTDPLIGILRHLTIALK